MSFFQMPRSVLLAMMVLSMSLCAAAANAQDAKSFWTDFIKKCASNETVGSGTLYLGPTNNLGAGTLWRKASAKSWRAVREFDDKVIAAGKRKDIVKDGSDVSCAGNKKTTSHFNPTLVLQSLLAPITGKFSLDMAKAKSVTVSADSYAWDQLLEGPFRDSFNDYSQQYRKDVVAPDIFVEGRVLRVKNIVAELTFDKKTAAELAATYKPGANQEVGAGLKGEWTAAGNLLLKAPGTSYLVVEMYDYNETGFAGQQKTFLKKVAVAPTAAPAKGLPK